GRAGKRVIHNKASAAGSDRPDPLNLFGQSRQDPTPGHVNGADRQAQFRGDGGGTLAFDGGPPERLPGGGGETVLDLGGGQAEELLLVFVFPGGRRVGLGAGLLVQAPPGAAVPAPDRLGAAALQELGELVAGDSEEPAAK